MEFNSFLHPAIEKKFFVMCSIKKVAFSATQRRHEFYVDDQTFWLMTMSKLAENLTTIKLRILDSELQLRPRAHTSECVD